MTVTEESYLASLSSFPRGTEGRVENILQDRSGCRISDTPLILHPLEERGGTHQSFIPPSLLVCRIVGSFASSLTLVTTTLQSASTAKNQCVVWQLSVLAERNVVTTRVHGIANTQYSDFILESVRPTGMDYNSS